MSTSKRIPLAGILLSLFCLCPSILPARAESGKTDPHPMGASDRMPARENVINVKEFGAVGTKEQTATLAIQRAIDSCAALGGGTVLFPAGDYLSGTLFLKSRVTIRIDPGATLYASNREEDYTRTIGFEDTGSGSTSVLFYAEHAEQIAFEGTGRIVGQPKYETQPLNPVNDFIQEDIDAALEAGLPLDIWRWKKPAVSLLFLTGCTNVRIRDISLLHSPFWTLHIHKCQRVHIDGIFISNDLEKAANSDGIDVDGCKDVVISNCVIETADDAICLKTTKGADGSSPCENVTVTNCILTSTSCALKLGTESHADFRHILFNNCVVRNSNRGLGIFIRDGGTVSDVIMSNITLECNRKPVGWWGSGDAIRFVVLKRTPSSRIGTIRDVLIKDVIARAQGTSLLSGFEGMQNLENIRLENVKMYQEAECTPDKRAEEGVVIRNAQNITLLNCEFYRDTRTVEKKWSHAFRFRNIRTLHVEGLKCTSTPGKNIPMIRLEGVRNAWIERCKPMDSDTKFLDWKHKSNTGIQLRDNGPDKP